MGKRIWIVVFCLSFLWSALAVVPEKIDAAGFQLFNEMSSRGTGLGAAMTAVGDSAETAWFNPAAVALMDRPEVQAGLALVVPSMKLERSGQDYEMKNMAYPVPNFYAVMPYGDRLGFSMSVNVPYGLTTEWDWGWLGETYAKKTELRCIFFTPSVSVKVTDWLSLGVGAQISRADAEMTKVLENTTIKTRIKGDDTGKGYMLSVFAKPAKDWNLGAVFRSHVKFDIDGTAKYDMLLSPSGVSLPLTLPPSLSLGVSTTAVENWMFTFDFLWTWWSFYESLDFQYDKAPGTLGTPGVVPYTKDWDDCYALRFGAEYTLNKNWHLRGSYVFDQSPIDDRYRDPSLPTNDRHLFSLGAGYAFNNLRVDGAYTYLKMEDSHPSQVTPLLDGTYKASAHIFNISATWIF